MRKTWALVFLAASCSGPTIQDSAREAFEAWRKALVEGDAETTFVMMSEGLKAQWLFERLTAEDAEAREWRRSLSGAPRTDLDLWLEYNRSGSFQRAARLPASVAGHPSFRELYRSYFMQALARVRQEFTGIKVSEVYADDTGASIAVRGPSGVTEMWQLVPEGTGWKIDHHKSAVRHLPRQ